MDKVWKPSNSVSRMVIAWWFGKDSKGNVIGVIEVLSWNVDVLKKNIKSLKIVKSPGWGPIWAP
jgi:hypothetical protein